ncbi:unnamed protein product [Coffea canephora]|uniref:beta-galactosidase n=1 Tax=Coffea canephora TaxID=49390 RepID=A0A068VL01_COFCA|nr:unnamed protein product [Coffea canephora]
MRGTTTMVLFLDDGKRKVLISGAIHCPRSTPQVRTALLPWSSMWPDLIQKSKDGGLDAIETYVFWNLYEPVRGQYDFEGRKDLVSFIKLVKLAGLYVVLRIGPYVCADFFFGLKFWSHFGKMKHRISTLVEMQRFTTMIVDLMKQESLFASQGGPIIFSEITGSDFRTSLAFRCGTKLLKYSYFFTTNTGVVWTMCQQNGAPDPIPDVFSYNFIDYFQYHGGTNFGRTSGGPVISTSYDYDAPLDEYAKMGHLKDLHKAIKLCEEKRQCIWTCKNISAEVKEMLASVYSTESGLCSAFLANWGSQSDATFDFSGTSYNLPAWSASILPACKNVEFNTAKINSMRTLSRFTRSSEDVATGASFSGCSWVNEPVGISSQNAFMKLGSAERIGTAGDKSDYLWYSASIEIKGNEPSLEDGPRQFYMFSRWGMLFMLSSILLFGSMKGSSGNAKVALEVPISLITGENPIDLLSLTMGLEVQPSFHMYETGVTGPVQLKGFTNGSIIDFSSQLWAYQVILIGLKGEEIGLSSTLGIISETVQFFPSKIWFAVWYPLTQFLPNFTAPPLALDLSGLGKGEAWVNGHSIGRYWPTSNAPNEGCTSSCNYTGTFDSNKCLEDCRKPSQILYHVPQDWLKPSGKVLVLFEQMRGDPTKISFAMRQIGSLCSQVSEQDQQCCWSALLLIRSFLQSSLLVLELQREPVVVLAMVNAAARMQNPSFRRLALGQEDATLVSQLLHLVTLVQALQRL